MPNLDSFECVPITMRRLLRVPALPAAPENAARGARCTLDPIVAQEFRKFFAPGPTSHAVLQNSGGQRGARKYFPPHSALSGLLATILPPSLAGAPRLPGVQ